MTVSIFKIHFKNIFTIITIIIVIVIIIIASYPELVNSTVRLHSISLRSYSCKKSTLTEAMNVLPTE